MNRSRELKYGIAIVFGCAVLAVVAALSHRQAWSLTSGVTPLVSIVLVVIGVTILMELLAYRVADVTAELKEAETSLREASMNFQQLWLKASYDAFPKTSPLAFSNAPKVAHDKAVLPPYVLVSLSKIYGVSLPALLRVYGLASSHESEYLTRWIQPSEATFMQGMVPNLIKQQEISGFRGLGEMLSGRTVSEGRVQ